PVASSDGRGFRRHQFVLPHPWQQLRRTTSSSAEVALLVWSSAKAKSSLRTKRSSPLPPVLHELPHVVQQQAYHLGFLAYGLLDRCAHQGRPMRHHERRFLNYVAVIVFLNDRSIRVRE